LYLSPFEPFLTGQVSCVLRLPKKPAGLACAYDVADTYVVQNDHVYLSFFEDEF
jgi:hypothetical protein